MAINTQVTIRDGLLTISRPGSLLARISLNEINYTLQAGQITITTVSGRQYILVLAETSVPGASTDTQKSDLILDAIDEAKGTLVRACITNVATYAALAALPSPRRETFYSVLSDEQNNGGNESKYSKKPDGSIYWWAAQKMN